MGRGSCVRAASAIRVCCVKTKKQRHSLWHLGIELPDEEELHRLWHDFISGHWHQTAKDFVARYVLDLLYLNGRTLADSELASDFIRRLNQPVLDGHPIKEASKRDQSKQQTAWVSNSLAGVKTGEQLIALVKKNDPKLYQQMQEEVWKDDDAAEWGNIYLDAAGNPYEAIDVLRQHLKTNLADKQDKIEPAEEEEDDGVEMVSPEEDVIACCKDWIDRLNEQLRTTISHVPVENIQETLKVNAEALTSKERMRVTCKLVLDQMEMAGLRSEHIHAIREQLVEPHFPALVDHPLFGDAEPTHVCHTDSFENVMTLVEEYVSKVNHDLKGFGISNIDRDVASLLAEILAKEGMSQEEVAIRAVLSLLVPQLKGSDVNQPEIRVHCEKALEVFKGADQSSMETGLKEGLRWIAGQLATPKFDSTLSGTQQSKAEERRSKEKLRSGRDEVTNDLDALEPPGIGDEEEDEFEDEEEEEEVSQGRYLIDSCKHWIDMLNERLGTTISHIPLEKIQETWKFETGFDTTDEELDELIWELVSDQLESAGLSSEEIDEIREEIG